MTIKIPSLQKLCIEKECSDYTRYAFQSPEDNKKYSIFKFPLDFEEEIRLSREENQTLNDECKQYTIRIIDIIKKTDSILVVTEECKELALRYLLEDTIDSTIAHFICVIESLFHAAVEFIRDNRVLVELSNYQLFLVKDRVKLLMVRSSPLLCGEERRRSHFHNSYISPRYRLWNWKASDTDTVFLLGNVIQYHTKIIQNAFNLFSERPTLLSTDTSFSIVMRYVEKQVSSKECVFDKTSFASSLYSISQEMISPLHSLSLAECIRLYNVMLAPEDQIRPKPIPSLPIPPVNVEEELLPLIVHPQRLPNERDCEWDALQTNQTDVFLDCIIPQLCQNDYYLMMCEQVLQYNHYSMQVKAIQQNQKEQEYPFLKCSVDELFELSLSESELALFLSVLNEQKEIEHSCLSENTLYHVAVTLLDGYATTHHSYLPTLLLHTLVQIPSCIHGLWVQKQSQFLFLINQTTLQMELRNNYLHILLTAVVDASPILQSFLPTQPNYPFLSNQTILDIVASKCSLPWLFELVKSMEHRKELLFTTAHVIVNHVIAAHMKTELYQTIDIEECLMIMKILQTSIHKAPILNSISFYDALMQLMKDVLGNIEDIRKTTEVVDLVLRFVKGQLNTDLINRNYLVHFMEDLQLQCKLAAIQCLKKQIKCMDLIKLIYFVVCL